MRFLVLLRATKAFSLQCDSFIHSSPIFLRCTRIASSRPQGAVCGSGSLLVPVLMKAAGLRYKPPERACVHDIVGSHKPRPGTQRRYVGPEGREEEREFTEQSLRDTAVLGQCFSNLQELVNLVKMKALLQ